MKWSFSGLSTKYFIFSRDKQFFNRYYLSGAYNLGDYSLELRMREFGTTYLGAYNVGAYNLGASNLGASGGCLRWWGPTGLPATDELG